MHAVMANAVHAGQSIYHAIQANHLDISQSSVYRYVHRGYCSFYLLDLPRAVKFKPRAKHPQAFVPKSVRLGRSYQDFQDFTHSNPGLNVVKMDTVIGRVGGMVLMTFQFVNADFMVALLLENKSAAEAAAKITALKECLNALGFSFVHPKDVICSPQLRKSFSR